jgi:CPA2 family monovalent cation:H+ antiporter-2
MLVGPLAPVPVVHDVATIRTLAELGVVLLLFSIGLEFRFRKLARLGPRVALATLVEVGLMLLLGYAAARLLGWGTVPSLFAAGIVAISSTMVVSRTMDDLHADRRLKDIVFGVLVMEDLAAIVLIALLTTAATGEDLSGELLGGTLAQLGLFLILLYVGGMLIIPRAINYALSFRRSETTLVAALGTCLVLAVISVESGYSVALGGFIAGTLVAESGKHRIVEEVVRPVRDLFTAIFFVAVGMLIDPAAVAQSWLAAVVLLLVVILGKLVGVTAGVFLAGYGTRDAVRSGMSLAQIGEFSFVIAGLGAASAAATGSGELYAVAVTVATVTAFTTPLFSRHADRVASWVDRHLPHPVQTVASLYASWVDLLGTRAPASEADQLRTRYIRFIMLDAACITAAVIGTSLLYRRMPLFLGTGAERMPMLRVLVLAGGTVLALPFAIGLVRMVRRLSILLSERALPKPARGVDQGHAPRRALVATLQIGMVIAIAVPMTVITLPFVPPYGTLGVIAAYLLILGVGFWRTASDLDKHTRAGAELVVHALSKQAHSGDTQTFEVVQALLPGMGTIVPLEVGVGSEAAGSTIGELNIRGRTGATIVALSRGGKSHPMPPATMRLEVGDMVAISGSGNAIGLAAALLRARDTSSPPTARDATAPPGA